MADPVLERLPAFRSHKIVRAAKITAAHAYLQDRRVGVEIHAADGLFDTIELEGKTAERFRLAFPIATDAVDSYLVVYPPSGDETEPYISWSPAGAFEGGYTRLQEGWCNFPDCGCASKEQCERRPLV